ncbi:hypothetical protein [Rubripirellula reticaptiva]|uniref:Uncharacterized protein n=1 Tax=Rubripirellula reticaptiva TaxID=2528013 RepID=A0A5C6EAB1_9BACT|nr:hypothetical protein [Rubripirellula reticaptiva]TWU46653.1 hypothetical protein Poly59_56260 [Rubripirellula reticaptiva]
MKNAFIESQWQELCERLAVVANHLGGSEDEVFNFRHQEPPGRYTEYLDCVRAAAQLANKWRDSQTLRQHNEELIDEAGRESFPASDPPTFSHSHA